MMTKRRFGRTGYEVSALGFGGAPMGYLDTEQKQVARLLNSLLDHGVNLIDTAASYAGSEQAIGKAISYRRNDYVLVSKCGRAFADLAGEAWSREAILATIDRSLRRLNTAHIDVMLLHSCDLDTLQKGEAVAALVEAREAGKILFAGYSGDGEAAVYAAGLDDVAVIETSINICDQANIDTVLPEAERQGVGVLAKRPIANAAWKALSEQRGMYADYARTYSQRLEKMNITPGDLGFEGDPARVWPEIALRFTLSQPGVTTAIVGTTKLPHVEGNIAIAAKGPLDVEVVRRLRDAFRSAEQADGKTWLGQQ
ncbi:MAG: aryl-alcohol dehydrogenase-like predicted oxidoreductase [Gammaproteobacteria bacterium]|jgi:aryl-alcohol dehydrogenase-like predicted oxidoreductase